MNILYLAHRIPYPPDKGDKIRSFHQVQHLARKHRVHLVCFVDDPDDLPHVARLREFCASVEVSYRGKLAASVRAGLALGSRRSLSVAAFVSGALRRRVQRVLAAERIDRIIVFSSAMAAYVQEMSDIPTIVDFVDVDSAKWAQYAEYQRFPLSLLYRLEAARLARYEARTAAWCARSIVISRAEADLFRRVVAGGPVSVIPNGVDLDYFNPAGADLASRPPEIVFTGAMDYFPNVDGVRFFCDEVLPLVRAEVPNASFCIVGRHPAPAVRVLADRPNVVVTGSVPDVRPYLSQAALAVAPLRIARGVQNKVLEAMAMGLPVVGTPNAFQGIGATAADGIRIASDFRGLAAEVLSLLRDPALRANSGRKARRYVERCHRWEDHGRLMEALLEEVS